MSRYSIYGHRLRTVTLCPYDIRTTLFYTVEDTFMCFHIITDIHFKSIPLCETYKRYRCQMFTEQKYVHN